MSVFACTRLFDTCNTTTYITDNKAKHTCCSMSKVVRLEASGFLHCSFHPMCTVTRSLNAEGVNYPRKAAQQYILKHENKCMFNPKLRTVVDDTSQPSPLSELSSDLWSSSSSNTPLVAGDNNLCSTIDCIVVSDWNNNMSHNNSPKLEQKLRNVTLVTLALATCGVKVWPSADVSRSVCNGHLCSQMISSTKHIVLVFHAGDFKSGIAGVQFLETLRMVKRSTKRVTLLLFDAPDVGTVVKSSLVGDEMIQWLESSDVSKFVVQMKFFFVVIEEIVNSISRLLVKSFYLHMQQLYLHIFLTCNLYIYIIYKFVMYNTKKSVTRI